MKQSNTKSAILSLLLAFTMLGLTPLFSQPAAVQRQPLTATFEDLPLEPGTYWNGSDGSGGFTSGPAWFVNSYNPEWMSWSGFSYSNMADDTTAGFMNQYSAITAAGYDPATSGGPNYAVAYVPTDWITYDPIPVTVRVTDPEAREVLGCYVTNSTSAALSMEFGDDYAKKFGGISGDDPDWFMLTIKGYKNDIETGAVDFYLADFRFEDNAQDYILEEWAWVDLAPLGEVDSLKFELSSSDAGTFGMNTPAYFCLDNLTFQSDVPLGPYISEVLEYVPAPGQLINTSPWGIPASAHTIVGGLDGTLSLGAFGGYVVFRFAQPVENHPDNPFGVDFTVFGNASQSWSEPGLVWVMKDDNNNGLPDDTWYELAGSDHYFSSSVKNYQVTYTNPGQTMATDVPWVDNQGGEGVIHAVAGHDQPYYPLPDSFPSVGLDSYSLTGSLIAAVVDSTMPVFIESAWRAFGFADNRPRGQAPYTLPDNPYTRELENSGGDAFDLDWAVDENGNYVDLEVIHFIKVQTAVLADGGWLGELSTEIAGAVDVPPDNTIIGQEKLIVVKDPPITLTSSQLQLEPYVFFRGRLQEDEPIMWTTNMPEASVDQNNLLTVTRSGKLEITASLADAPEVWTTVNTTVDLSSSSINSDNEVRKCILYPNPTDHSIRITGSEHSFVSVMDLAGNILLSMDGYREGQEADVSTLSPGLYFVRIRKEKETLTLKFIKR